MPLTGPRAEDTDIRMLADALRRIRRLEQRKSGGGFDPNENPVIIGLSATGGGGSTPSSLSGSAYSIIAIGYGAQVDAATGVAVGFGAESGQASVAVGDSANAAGEGSVAIGQAATAGPDPDGTSTAVGTHANAAGISSTAIGCGSHANSDNASALGLDAGAIGVSAVAIGANAAAGQYLGTAADYAVAVGSASAYGTESIAIGRLSQTTETATGGVSIGKSSYANGVNSTALGCGARAGDHELVLGTDTENVIMPGAVAMPGLPTADPLVSGAVWNDGGVLTVSP